LRAGLRDLGYIEGKDIIIEYRWAEQNYDRLPALAAELVNLNVDVILTHASPGTLAVTRATRTIPIVITAVADMIALGVVSSLSRPGGNVTGLSIFTPELAAKRLELVKDVLPSLTKAAVISNADNPIGTKMILEELATIAAALKVEVVSIETHVPSDFERAFAAMANQKIAAAVVHEDPALNANSQALADVAAKYRLPVCGFPEFARAGGLIGYGINFPDTDRRAASYVDKILKGAKPGDLPVERATKFTTVVNLKAAKTIGVELPTSILLRADEVIE
jgi:putative tryptophan/tyrosine transport system substrate-binding protein